MLFYFYIDNSRPSSGQTRIVVGVVLSVVIILCVGVALTTVFIVWRKRKVVMSLITLQFTTDHLPPVSC